MKLYRYIKVLGMNENNEEIVCEKLKKTLENSRMYFSHPATFNDPLEGVIPIGVGNKKCREAYYDYVESEMRGRIGENCARYKRFQEVKKFGLPLENGLIACLSHSKDNLLMWSHYAAQHQGVCLCYEFPDTVDEIREQITYSSAINSHITECGMELEGKDVSYKINRPALRFQNTDAPVKEWKIDNEYSTREAYFIKPECWKYEEEWRMGIFYPLGCVRAFSPDCNTDEYYVTLPKGWLKEVTFGMRLDSKYCDDIIECIKANDYEKVIFKQEQLEYNKFRVLSRNYEWRK